MPANPILDASNHFIEVTNYEAYEGSFQGVTRTLSTLDGFPLTTSDGSATGQICVPVVAVGAPLPPSGGSFETTFINATSGSTVPTDVLGWSITAISGTVTVDGDALPNGSTVRGGGYPGYTLGTAVTYTVTAGVALVTYDSVL